jgi:hypothetical protein
MPHHTIARRPHSRHQRPHCMHPTRLRLAFAGFQVIPTSAPTNESLVCRRVLGGRRRAAGANRNTLAYRYTDCAAQPDAACGHQYAHRVKPH